MVLLLGGNGYIGQAFARQLRRNKEPFISIGRTETARYDIFVKLLRERKPTFLINAAGYTGKPNVDACENKQTETLLANSLFPQMLAIACTETQTPWGHVSSGCIYHGAKLISMRNIKTEKQLTSVKLRKQFERNPESFCGFNELDEPNFTFRSPPCSFYSGSKFLGEEAIRGIGKCYIWRLRMPFSEVDGPRNYLSKIQRYSKVYDNINSISHLDDFVAACLKLWKLRANFGIYNVTNPGAVSTEEVVSMIERILKPQRRFKFWKDDEEFYRCAARAPRSNCILDVSKLLETGVSIRPVRDALEDALRSWIPESNKKNDTVADRPL